MWNIQKQFKKLKKITDGNRDIQLTDEDALQYQDVLMLLEERGYIHDLEADGMNWYRKIVEWEGFEEWLDGQIKESNRVSRREYIIGIVCAIVGALIGLVPYFIQ